MKLLAKEIDTFQVCVLHEWATISTIKKKVPGLNLLGVSVPASVWQEAGVPRESTSTVQNHAFGTTLN